MHTDCILQINVDFPDFITFSMIFPGVKSGLYMDMERVVSFLQSKRYTSTIVYIYILCTYRKYTPGLINIPHLIFSGSGINPIACIFRRKVATCSLYDLIF